MLVLCCLCVALYCADCVGLLCVVVLCVFVFCVCIVLFVCFGVLFCL